MRLSRSGIRARSGFDVVRRLGLPLPDVEESLYFGVSALKVRGQMFACLASHRSAEPDTLVVRLEFAQRDELLDAKPGTYYLTDHYVGYPCVLVRLGRIRQDELRDLLLMAWRFMSAAKAPRFRKRARKPGRAPRAPAGRPKRTPESTSWSSSVSPTGRGKSRGTWTTAIGR